MKEIETAKKCVSGVNNAFEYCFGEMSRAEKEGMKITLCTLFVTLFCFFTLYAVTIMGH